MVPKLQILQVRVEIVKFDKFSGKLGLLTISKMGAPILDFVAKIC